MVVASAWALGPLDTSVSQSVRWDNWEDRQEMRENSLRLRQQLRELNGEIRDYRDGYRKDIMDARADCNAMLQAESSEEMKNQIRAECEAEFKLLREALRENIVSLYRDRYVRLVIDIRLQMNAAFSTYFKNLSVSEMADFMAWVNVRLNTFEDNANQNKRDIHVLWAAAIRAVLDEWKSDM